MDRPPISLKALRHRIGRMEFEQRMRAQAHLLYELGGMATGLCLLRDVLHSQDQFVVERRGALSNAALESMLVHSRNVIEFLVGRPPSQGQLKRRQNKRDILPADFAPAWQLPTGSHPLDEWLDLIDKHLSHLSRARLAAHDDEPEWHDAILREVAQVLKRFVEEVAATESGFGASLQRQLDEIQTACESGPATQRSR